MVVIVRREVSAWASACVDIAGPMATATTTSMRLNMSDPSLRVIANIYSSIRVAVVTRMGDSPERNLGCRGEAEVWVLTLPNPPSWA
jgi:hypothetical protein